MNIILSNLIETICQQYDVSDDTFRIGVHGACYLSTPIDDFCDDGLFLISETMYHLDDTPHYTWSIVLVECGNISIYNDIPFVLGFEQTLKYFFDACYSYDALTLMQLYGESAYYEGIKHGKPIYYDERK